ncbi:hypothetical protein B7494_g5266 [Chlorociboria aeruginascens]|nr:hypothetical protein B7494_g5266 [Chlorociboria aeruginascens]
MTEQTLARQTLQNRLDFDDDESNSDSISVTSTQGEAYESDQEFLVERVLAEKIKASIPYYLILWDGYPLEMSTWEPRENIQDESILDIWKERKTQEARGLKPTFDLANFYALLQKSEAEKANRHKRRKIKRKRKGLPVSESEADYDSESMDSGELGKSPSTRGLTSRLKNPVTRKQAHAPSEGETHKRVQPKQNSNRSESEDAPLSDDSLIQDLQREAYKKAQREERKKEAPREPRSPESRKAPKASKRPRRISSSSSDIPLARKRDLQHQALSSNKARTTYDGSLSDEPLAHQGRIPQGKPAPGAGKNKSSHASAPNTTSRGLTSRTPAGRGKGATRGGLSYKFTNVFAPSSKPPRKGRPNISENAADPTKAQKHFKNQHLLRKAELSGRSRADAAPDLDAIGGLFDPSNPLPYQSLKPATLRKKSATVSVQDDPVVERTLTTDRQPDTAQIWGEQPRTQAQKPPQWERRFSGSLRCYFFVNTGSCMKQKDCKFIHSNDDRIPVAHPPNFNIKNPPSTSNCPPSGPSQGMTSNNTNESPTASTSYPKASCKFWLLGDCKVGKEYCKYSHEDPPSEPNFIPEKSRITPNSTRNSTATFPAPKSVSFAFDEPVQGLDDCPNNASPTRPENSEKHSQTGQADTMSIGHLSKDAFSREKGPTEHSPTPAMYEGSTCKYWQKGYCRWSTDCRFSHEIRPAENNQSAFPNTPSQFSSVDKPAGRANQILPYKITPENPTATVLPLSQIQSMHNYVSSPVPSNTNLETLDTPTSQSTPSTAMLLLPSPSQATPAAPLNPNRKIMNIEDYHRHKAIQSIAGKAKEVIFGTDGLTSLMADFGRKEMDLQQPWVLSFRSLAQLQFNHVCVAQDFETQYADLKSQLCWQGSMTADPRGAAYLKIIDRVVDHLNNTSTGLVSVHSDLTILAYPARSEKWKFVEGPAIFPADARLRYLIFQTALGVQDTPQQLSNGSVRLRKENTYKKILVTRLYDLHFRALLPNTSQDPYNFYLLFPSTASSSANVLASWLKSCRDCKIYHSEIEGSWDHFCALMKTGKTGVILIHESAIALVSELPSILRLSHMNTNFWHIADSASRYPLFPSLSFHADDPKPGQIIPTRLFPHGAAIFLTPSFIIADPHKTRNLLVWFTDKFRKSTTGTYKLLSCHDLKGYLLELACRKADESEEFYAENSDKPAKDALAMKKGLGYHDCAVRFEIRQLVDELLSHTTLLDYPSPNDFDNLDETVSPVIYADSRIDPDDEHALVDWFAGWSMTRLDRFRKFAVMGTGREHRVKATRLKYVSSSGTTPTATVHTNRTLSSNEKVNSTIDDHDSPQKSTALEVAKKPSENLVNNSSRANEPLTAQPNLPILQTNSSESPLFVPPNDNTWSPQSNESDSQPRLPNSKPSKISNDGIKIGKDGRKFIPQSLRPSRITRSKTDIRPGYTPPEDKEIYEVRQAVDGVPSYENSSRISSRRESMKSNSTERPLISSPYSLESLAMPEDMDVDRLVAEVIAAANATDADTGNEHEGKLRARSGAISVLEPGKHAVLFLKLGILAPLKLPLDLFMCSQSGNTQDLAAYSGHSSAYIVGSEDPDNSSKQDFVPPPSLPSDMGLRYITIPATDDVRFSPDSDTSHSPVYSITPSIPTPSSSSTLSFSHFLPNVYHQPSLNGSTYPSGNPYFSPGSSIFSIPDIKPRLNSIHSSPGMAPPSRSPALPHSSTFTAREAYTSATPHLRRTSDLLSRSPSASGTGRGVPLSPSSSGGFTSPTAMDNSTQGPPLNPTEVIHELQASDGHTIRPEIYGRIDKGFFMADNDWTCYRRNYFSLNCSYTLLPALPTGTIHLIQPGSTPQVYGFALSIAAVVDGRDGKAIELVQHTPKRDKGPQEKPAKMAVSPRPPPNLGIYASDSGIGNGSRGLYEAGFGQSPTQPIMEVTFERIQFKNATANNGKRRAAQQYYHLLVELFADVGQQQTERYIKIATRMSAPMVVRGRSPGHYQSERRGSNTSAGPGGSGGAGGGGSYTPSGSASRASGDISMSGAPSMLPGSSYPSSYDTRSQHHYRPNASVQIPMEPTLSAEEAKSIEESPCYLYYPGPIYEGHESRYQLPSLPEYVPGKIKQEFGSGYVLPSLSSTHEGFGRQCGRWEGVQESKGYFPTTVLQQELNIS